MVVRSVRQVFDGEKGSYNAIVEQIVISYSVLLMVYNIRNKISICIVKFSAFLFQYFYHCDYELR